MLLADRRRSNWDLVWRDSTLVLEWSCRSGDHNSGFFMAGWVGLLSNYLRFVGVEQKRLFSAPFSQIICLNLELLLAVLSLDSHKERPVLFLCDICLARLILFKVWFAYGKCILRLNKRPIILTIELLDMARRRLLFTLQASTRWRLIMIIRFLVLYRHEILIHIMLQNLWVIIKSEMLYGYLCTSKLLFLIDAIRTAGGSWQVLVLYCRLL